MPMTEWFDHNGRGYDVTTSETDPNAQTFTCRACAEEFTAPGDAIVHACTGGAA